MLTEGFVYQHKRDSKEFSTYYCKENKRKRKNGDDVPPCPAQIKFYNKETMILINNHNHEPVVGSAEAI